MGAVAAKSPFGTALSGSGLTSFAKPGEAFKSDKPAKPFGAPDSDAEDSADDDSNGEDDSESDGGENNEEADADERSKAGGEEKKKKLQRGKFTPFLSVSSFLFLHLTYIVVVDDGEAGEATLLQVRARLYYLDKDLGGWKERGAGMLKVNVPEQCVDFDREGNVIPASFDASMLDADSSNGGDGDDDDDKEGTDESAGEDAPAPKPKSKTGVAALPRRTVVRMIMRQDSTHRVILNTVVLPYTEYKERQMLKATTVLFTAIEGDGAKPVSIQVKASSYALGADGLILAFLADVANTLADECRQRQDSDYRHGGHTKGAARRVEICACVRLRSSCEFWTFWRSHQSKEMQRRAALERSSGLSWPEVGQNSALGSCHIVHMVFMAG